MLAMRTETLQELLDKGLLTPKQFESLNSIVKKRTFSVFYELRTMLYLGVMLFTSGVGILIYENIGDLGHIISVSALLLLTISCFLYVFNKGLPYSPLQVKSPTVYFDYVLLFGCLLFISVIGYFQFYFGIFADELEWSTSLTALYFFFCAYRFNHLGVLSLAITALASFFSIKVSPQLWTSVDAFMADKLYNTALMFSLVLSIFAILLDVKNIKRHFTFTYINFASIIFFIASLVGVFSEESPFSYYLILYAGCAGAIYFAIWKKSFLFLLYSFLGAYIGTSHLLGNSILMEELWFLYMIISCGGFIYFILKFRNYFKRQE